MPITIHSPLSGRIVSLCAEPQAAVALGDALLIVESMKMEIPIEAEGAATIARFLVAVGDEVSEGQAVVELQ